MPQTQGRPEQKQAQTQANQQIQSNVSPANATQANANAAAVNTAPVNQANQAQTQTAQDRSTQTQTAAGGQRQAPPAKPEVGALQESVVVRDAGRAAGRGGATAASPELMMFRADAPSLDIPSPDSAIRWRVVGQRAIGRTTDGGSTWQSQTVDVPLPLTAGSASSSTVCWLVGRAGLVLRTTDGGTWQRVRFPEAVDLTDVRATDGNAAVVTTSDGRTFATADGGQTWSRK